MINQMAENNKAPFKPTLGIIQKCYSGYCRIEWMLNGKEVSANYTDSQVEYFKKRLSFILSGQ